MPVAHLRPDRSPCRFPANANSHCLHCGVYVTMERPRKPSHEEPEDGEEPEQESTPVSLETPSNEKLDALRAGVAKAPTWMILDVLKSRGAEIGEIAVGKNQGCIVILATGADRRPGQSFAPDPDEQISRSPGVELGSAPEEQAPN